MAKVTLNTIAGDYGSKELINDNFSALATAMENTLSRDGTSPNTMAADLDLNSNKIINLTDPTNNQDGATKKYVDDRIATGAASAAAAAASAAAALTSENNAATSEANAATSETNAAASAAAAAASFDAFDDIYLGAKASDPTVDNDGDALTVGDVYFNTTVNQIKVYDGASWSVAPQITGIVSNADATAITIDSSENVGIGTSTPDARLHILDSTSGTSIGSPHASIIISNTDQTANNRAGLIFTDADDATQTASIHCVFTDHTNNYGDLTFNTRSAAGVVEKMRINSSGDIGIGTTPAAKFHVDGGATTTALFTNTSSGATASDGTQLRLDSLNHFRIWHQENADIYFGTNSTERMRISSSGNVGIGETNPDETLHLNGNTPVLKITDTTAAGAGYIDFDATNLQINVQRNPNTGVFENTSKAHAAITLQGADADSNIKFYTTNVNNTAATERMRITSTGAVGIGVTPSHQLDVEGSYGSDYLVKFKNTHATTPRGLSLVFSGGSPDNNVVAFLKGSDSTTDRIIIYSDGDIVNHDGTYGTISDRKLKQDVVLANSQWDDVKAIGALGKNYRHKKDVAVKGKDAKVMLGWEAQDIELISPGLVMHTFEDITDEEGNTIGQEETLGIRSSILFTKAVMALSEAMSRIEALEAEVSSLQAA